MDQIFNSESVPIGCGVSPSISSMSVAMSVSIRSTTWIRHLDGWRSMNGRICQVNVAGLEQSRDKANVRQ